MAEVYRFAAAETLDAVSQTQYQYITQMKNVTTLHDHDFCEVFLVAYGQVDHQCNGQVTRLQPGDMMLMRPLDRHCYRPVPGEGCGLFNLAFSAELMSRALNYLTDGREGELMRSPMPAAVHLSGAELKEWAARFRALELCPVGQREVQGYQARTLLLRLLAALFLTPRPTAAQARVPEWLATLRREMGKPENFRQGVQAMCVLCPCSKEHLYRCFRRFYQETPSAFVHRLQLSFAANLLAHTTMSITQTALEVGYENLGYFYQCFREQFGMTPQAYRRMAKKDAV